MAKKKEKMGSHAPDKAAQAPFDDVPFCTPLKTFAGKGGIGIALQGESWKLAMDALAFWAAFEDHHDRVEKALALRSHIERKLKAELRRRGVIR